MMKFLFFLVVVILGVANGTADQGNDHNGAEHKALCHVLKAAVHEWESKGDGLLEPLKTALHRTIFGNETGGSLETLRNGLPKVYDDVLGGADSRNMACGQVRNAGGDYYNVHQPRWSGHSAPHDLVCLCTLGNNSWPLNDTQKATTLCGQEKSALGAEKGTNGWSAMNTGKEQMEATWGSVVVQCLESGGNENSLKEALKSFTGKLVHKPGGGYSNSKQLGEGDPDEVFACTGSSIKGVCVEYYPTLTAHTWWVDLDKAIEEDHQIQKEREEEQRRRQQEDSEKKETAQEAVLKSTHTITNQTEAPNKDKLHESMRKLNLTSGTPISKPSSWLLSVVFLF
ncbi:Variant surface glycoprotein [Trypanosoma congolense IL3000]|uniref:Variant surface glycoprotein n=1 Tax=Trypanosoma congolense (strain IL3000) TaxID=1068625 RepID=F9WIN2_TRYCI|nr:Variant surface glycoprotein [Trypanosoma congolense IL3000]